MGEAFFFLDQILFASEDRHRDYCCRGRFHDAAAGALIAALRLTAATAQHI
jgi:hypothetical protein